MLNKIKRIPKKTVVIALAIAVIFSISAIVFAGRQGVNPDSQQSPNTGISYSPPTQAEKDAANNQKQRNADKEKAIEDAQNNPTKTASLIVTDASFYPGDGNKVEVRAYVANVYESGGTCTATFTRNGQTVTVANTAFKDVTTTQCGAMDVSRAEFNEAGDWLLVVAYSSSTVSGQTSGQTVSVKP